MPNIDCISMTECHFGLPPANWTLTRGPLGPFSYALKAFTMTGLTFCNIHSDETSNKHQIDIDACKHIYLPTNAYIIILFIKIDITCVILACGSSTEGRSRAVFLDVELSGSPARLDFFLFFPYHNEYRNYLCSSYKVMQGNIHVNCYILPLNPSLCLCQGSRHRRPA